MSGCLSSSDDGCQQGSEGCGCYGNGTCDTGLSCLSDKCVDPSGGSSNAGGSMGSGELPSVDLEACLSCGETACPTEWSACRDQGECTELTECSLACDEDLSCLSDCRDASTADDVNRATSFVQCAFLQCIEECTVGAQVPSTGGTTAEPGGGSTGPGAEPTNPEPESPTIPALNEGRDNWLTLDGEVAPGSDPLNAALNINGVFYAYSDDCATVSWDAVNRCIEGTLCAASAENWGVGIGFDFRNDGTLKYAWDATAVHTRGAYAVAWKAAGTSSREFQAWLTNIDPSVGGQCPATSDCGISGPPDGEAYPAADGLLYFSNLRKDDWGGSGTSYTFDPTQILALQLKIPSSTTETAYQLCIQQLGIYVNE